MPPSLIPVVDVETLVGIPVNLIPVVEVAPGAAPGVPPSRMVGEPGAGAAVFMGAVTVGIGIFLVGVAGMEPDCVEIGAE